jgi:hypothetical protein
MYKWLFHVGANLIEKKKLLRKFYEPALKIYTNETYTLPASIRIGI